MSQEPTKIGKYDVVKVLGRGGMGIVYHARDNIMGRDVAIKTLTEGFAGDRDMLRRFYQEAGHTGKLQHPNIVIVYDVGDENGQPYIVMEYLEGQPLDQIIREETPLHLGAKLHIIEQVCQALSYAHRQGVVHRDVKPANVIVQPNGVTKLLDFGIARREQASSPETMTQTGTLIGTPKYMAPERFQGLPFDGRSDTFSTGVMLYQLLTGRLPFDAEYPAIIGQILNDPYPPLGQFLKDYPERLDSILERALAKDPGKRYSQADEMAADLNSVAVEAKAHRVAELLEQSERSLQGQDFDKAQTTLQELLKLDRRNMKARQLMLQVEQHNNRCEVERRIQRLCAQIEECLTTRDWEQAIALSDEAARLDELHPTVVRLRETAREAKLTRGKVEQLLREADAARRAGEYEEAKEHAKRAYELDREDSKVLRICKVLEQEAENARKRKHAASLRQAAEEHLFARRFQEALNLVQEAEALTPSDPELLRLKDEIDTAREQERRRKLRVELQQEAALAITLEQVQAFSGRLERALEDFATDPALLKLKMQTEQRQQDLTRLGIVEEAQEICRHLAPEEAIVRIREALAQVPGNETLIALEASVEQRLRKLTRDQLLRQYLSEAKEAINKHLYLEAVKILEKCQADGFSSVVIAELMEFAKSTAKQRVQQEVVERNYLQAQALLDQQNFEGAEQLLQAALQQVEEPMLRKLLEQASKGRVVIDEKVGRLLAVVEQLVSIGQYDAAVRVLEAEPAHIRRITRVSGSLNQCQAMANREKSMMEALGGCYAASDPRAMRAALDEFDAAGIDAPEAFPFQSILQRARGRHEQYADQRVMPAIESARAALSNEGAAQAEQCLLQCAEWSSIAGPAMREQIQQLLAEIAASKKLLRFRRASQG